MSKDDFFDNTKRPVKVDEYGVGTLTGNPPETIKSTRHMSVQYALDATKWPEERMLCIGTRHTFTDGRRRKFNSIMLNTPEDTRWLIKQLQNGLNWQLGEPPSPETAEDVLREIANMKPGFYDSNDRADGLQQAVDVAQDYFK